MKARVYQDAYLEIHFPATVDIANTKLKEILADSGFIKQGTEFSQKYVYTGNTYDYLAIGDAHLIKALFNSGKREYCQELLTPKTRIKHG
jgi:hypothetical protein